MAGVLFWFCHPSTKSAYKSTQAVRKKSKLNSRHPIMFVNKSRSTGNPNKKKIMMEVDDDDRTVSSSGSGKNGREMVENNVKWCITGMSDATIAKSTIFKILATILHSFTDDMIIIDHKSQEFTYNNDHTNIKSLEDQIKAANIPIHKARTKSERQLNRWYVTHKIRTTQSISVIKKKKPQIYLLPTGTCYGSNPVLAVHACCTAGVFGGLPVGGALCREILSYGGTMLRTAVNCWAKGIDPILEAVKIWPCYDVVLGRSEEDVPVGRVDL